MNSHPIMLEAIARQHRAELVADAQRWTRAARILRPKSLGRREE